MDKLQSATNVRTSDRNEVQKQLPTEFLFTEACYQRSLAYYLAKFGSVECERVLNYNITDQGREITVDPAKNVFSPPACSLPIQI